eukprot:TRINITY_DN2167_c0_g2_i1.p1 TRINITY_DN2167_c0_g2~~TRINITY_DN2167_c0_g2_i1.p1  ORF type:complete len:1509 (+),score=532.80 TRINITY_DN2167_c0_g2_i1:603-4529(+)
MPANAWMPGCWPPAGYPLPMMPGIPLGMGQGAVAGRQYEGVHFPLVPNPFAAASLMPPSLGQGAPHKPEKQATPTAAPAVVPPVAPSEPPAEPAAASPGGVVRCDSCAGELIAGARFCHHCGSSCAPPSCSRCATPFAHSDAAFCHRCGHPSQRGARRRAPGSDVASTPPPALSTQMGLCEAPISPNPAPQCHEPREDASDRRLSPQPHARESPSSGSFVAGVASAPWLEYSGLPADGTVEVSVELEAFSNFQCATASERARRSAVRTSLQKLVQLAVCPEATVKLIGGWATGLAAYDSALDLVLEAPTGFEDPLASLASALQVQLGVAAEHTTAGVGAMPCIAIDASTLLDALSDGQARSAAESFTVIVYAGGPGSAARAATNAVRNLITRGSHLKPCLVALRAALRHLGEDAGISGHAITLMALAFFERTRRTGGPHDDPGAMFCDFFRFYAAFDFSRFSVCPFPATASGDFFPPKQHPGAYLSLVVMNGGSSSVLCSEETAVAQLAATFEYLTQVIERWEFGKASGGANCRLLANVVPMRQLGARHKWLQQRAGLEATKELAVAVAKGVADFLEDPANVAAKKEFLEMAAWDTVQGMVRDARLLRRVVDTPGSELSALREYVPDLQKCLESYSQDPDVRKQETKSVGNAMSIEQLAPLMEEIATFLESTPDSGIRQQLLTLHSVSDSGESMAENLFGYIAKQPGSLLAPFQEMIPGVLSAMHANKSNPKFRALLGKVLGAAVDLGLLKEMTREVIAFLKDPANKGVVEESFRAASASQSTDWAGALPLLERISESRPGCLISLFKAELPLLVEVLQDRYYDEIASGSADPELCQLISTAATSAVTKDIALVIASHVCDFLEDPANEAIRQDVVRTAQSDTTDKLVLTHKRLFQEMAEKPGSPLVMYRHNISGLVDVMDSFHGDPDIDDARRRAARAIINKDVADLMLRDVADMLDSDSLHDVPDDVQGKGSWRTTAAAVWENLESRVSREVFAKLCEESPAWCSRMKQAGGVGSVHDTVRRLMVESVAAFSDEPEMRALRRRAAQAAAGRGAMAGSELSEPPPDLESDFVSDSFYTPPDSPTEDSAGDRGFGDEKAVVRYPSEVPSADSNPEVAVNHPATVPTSLFSDLAVVRSQTVAVEQEINAPLSFAFAAALSDEPKAPLLTFHRQRGDTGVHPPTWQLTESWGGVRLMQHEAMTPLGKHQCNESQRFAVCDTATGRRFSLHWSSQVSGIPLGGLFRTETLYDFAEAEGKVVCTCRTHVDASALGMMAGVVRAMARAAAAEVGIVFLKLVSEQAEKSYRAAS